MASRREEVFDVRVCRLPCCAMLPEGWCFAVRLSLAAGHLQVRSSSAQQRRAWAWGGEERHYTGQGTEGAHLMDRVELSGRGAQRVAGAKQRAGLPARHHDFTEETSAVLRALRFDVRLKESAACG